MNKVTVIIYILIVSLVACGGRNSTNVETPTTVETKGEVAPSEGVVISFKSTKSAYQGEVITIIPKANHHVDSLALFINNKRVAGNPVNGQWDVATSTDDKVGKTAFRIKAYKNSLEVSRIGSYTLKPKDKPIVYKATAKEVMTHDTETYTQGLEFYNNYLYESSGEYGKSHVQYMNFPSMEVVKRRDLDSKMFAEGLTVLNDKLYLLTWQENTCFVFDPVTLSEIKRFTYNTEGWGLTNDGVNLYMSDGSQYIYVLNPDTFKQIDRIEVMAGEKSVTQLNELEWINGEIWANVYTTDEIVRINPKTGVVTAVVDARGLMLDSDYKYDTDVLNGIVYDKGSKKLYLTGKKWPKFFEVSISEVK